MTVRIFDSNIGPAVWAQHDQLQPTAFSCQDAIEVKETLAGICLAQGYGDAGADSAVSPVRSYAFRISGPAATCQTSGYCGRAPQ